MHRSPPPVPSSRTAPFSSSRAAPVEQVNRIAAEADARLEASKQANVGASAIAAEAEAVKQQASGGWVMRRQRPSAPLDMYSSCWRGNGGNSSSPTKPWNSSTNLASTSHQQRMASPTNDTAQHEVETSAVDAEGDEDEDEPPQQLKSPAAARKLAAELDQANEQLSATNERLKLSESDNQLLNEEVRLCARS